MGGQISQSQRNTSIIRIIQMADGLGVAGWTAPNILTNKGGGIDTVLDLTARWMPLKRQPLGLKPLKGSERASVQLSRSNTCSIEPRDLGSLGRGLNPPPGVFFYIYVKHSRTPNF